MPEPDLEERLNNIEAILKANKLHETTCSVFVFPEKTVPKCDCWLQEIDPNLSYFVVASGRGKELGTSVSLIAAESREQAHAHAAKAHREKRKLPDDVHIDTYVLAQEAVEADAASYMTELLSNKNEEAKDAYIHALDEDRPDTKE